MNPKYIRVFPGGSAEFKCSSFANVGMWFFATGMSFLDHYGTSTEVNVSAVQSNSTIKIVNATRDHSGYYICPKSNYHTQIEWGRLEVLAGTEGSTT